MSRRRDQGEFYRIAGVCLRAEREIKGVSQQALGAHLGITSTAVHCIESGKSKLSLETVVHACAFLKADPLDMLTKIVRLTANVPRETSP